MAGVQGPGGIRRDELHLHRLAATGIRPSVARLLLQDARDDGEAGVAAQAEVDETRSRDLRRGEATRRGGRPRLPAQPPPVSLRPLCALQCDVRREVAMAGLLGPLDQDMRAGVLGRYLR